MKLSYKLFLAFFSILLIVLAFMVFMTRYVVKKDFEASVNRMQLSNVENIVRRFENEYRTYQSWDRFKQVTDDDWRFFVAPNLPLQGSRQNNRAFPDNPSPGAEQFPRGTPPAGRMQGRPDQGEEDPFGISGRISLYNDKNELIAGNEIPEDKIIFKEEIKVGEELVGWLVIGAAEYVENPSDTRYLALLVKSLYLVGSISLIFATLAAIILSRNITAPIKELAKGARALASQKLTTRIKIKRKDELGQLASDFNRMAEQLEIMAKKIQEASLVDHLTGLKNRRYLYDTVLPEATDLMEQMQFRLKHGEDKRQQKDKYFGILLFDIDYFKKINDKYGHNAGDRILKQFSMILTRSVRSADVTVRIGGEEFLVVLKNVSQESARNTAKKIKRHIASQNFIINDSGDTCNITCSVGHVIFPFLKTDPNLFDLEDAIALSDLALYYAKQNDRNLSIGITPTGKAVSQDQKEDLLKTLEFGIENKLWELMIVK